MENQITLGKISRVYEELNEQGSGPTGIKLTFDESEELVTLHIRCSDDCEPYWSWMGEYPCTLKNLARLLVWVNNFGFSDDYGEPYSLFVEWVNEE